MPDQDLLLEVVTGFARAAAGDFRVADILADLAHAAGRVLAVDGAGVDYLAGDQMRFAHASSDLARRADLAEIRFQEGPCQDARAIRETVVEADLERSTRWPRYTPAAVAAGVGSVAGVPLLARGRVWGALDLFRRRPGPFEAADLVAAQVLADVAVGYLVMAHDRDAAQAAQRASEHAATHDPLTGLPNRILIYDRIRHALARAKRPGKSTVLLFLDLDGFKQVNDEHGHHLGDLVLVEFAARLRATVRAGDSVGRLGGDEFVVLCEDLATIPSGDVSETAVAAVKARIEQALAAPARLDGTPVTLHASIGIATAAPDLRDPYALIRAADTAMYAAKRATHSHGAVTPSATRPQPIPASP